ncbi:uncharacterized protein C3orf84-like [Branchiostoma floridae]|uniref:Uncharacterized protein C3orf84-like n=1 Tax=Branchiostoma floridae TaxID=7739 RepID=A0A9J7MRX7_BRAFL|nr:uncharacterized protein C3orf84-like [Branchiostoma floridae]
MATGGSVGAWFPTGYHGHFRSKSRNDFLQEFRRRARPQPPSKFITRIRERPTSHTFSHHDNKNAFVNDGYHIATAGCGLKKPNNPNLTGFKPDFIHWMPHRDEIHRDGPNASTYRQDFTKSAVLLRRGAREDVPQILVGGATRRPSSSLSQLQTTTYSFAHSHGQPNSGVLTDMNTGVRLRSAGPDYVSHDYLNKSGRIRSRSLNDVPTGNLTGLRRARDLHVGDCLSWHVPERPPVAVQNAWTPAATPVTVTVQELSQTAPA